EVQQVVRLGGDAGHHGDGAGHEVVAGALDEAVGDVAEAGHLGGGHDRARPFEALGRPHRGGAGGDRGVERVGRVVGAHRDDRDAVAVAGDPVAGRVVGVEAGG